MSTPSNNQDTTKSEPEKPNLFGGNLFKTSPNPFPTKTDAAPSGSLFSSATSNASQQDGNKGIFGTNTGSLFNQGNAQATGGGLFGARSQPQKEGSKQENKTNAPLATGMFALTTAPGGGLFGKPQGESAPKQESTPTSGGMLALNKTSTQQEAPKQEAKTTGLFGSNTSNTMGGGLFGAAKAQGETEKKEATPTSENLFNLNKTAAPQETEKQETKTNAPVPSGIFGSTTNGGLFGGNKTPAQGETPKQENSSNQPAAGGLFNMNKTAENKAPAATGMFGSITTKTEDKTEKQETKTTTPPATGIFGSAPSGGLFGGAKVQTEAPKQETKTSAPAPSGMFSLTPASGGGLFGFGKTQGELEKKESTPTSGGVFGLSKPSTQQETKPTTPLTTGIFGSKTEDKNEKQETKTITPPATGIFGSTPTAGGGLFGGAKVQTEAPKQETKTTTPPATGIFGSNTSAPSGGGLFGLGKTQGDAAAKQETTPANPQTTGVFGGQTSSSTSWPSFNATATTTNPQTSSSSTMFQAREAPAKKKKDEMSTLSPEKKIAPVNIPNLPSGVQSSLFTEPTKTTNLFGKIPATQEPKKSQVLPQVDDAKLDESLKNAIAKEEKVTQKIKDLTSKMNNTQIVDQFLKEQNQAIDEFYAEFTQNLVKKIAEIANQQKQNLKNKLAEEAQEFKKTTEELTGHLNKLLAENSLATIKDQLLSAAKDKKDAEQAVKSTLAHSFELENGFSPLVKKYKAIKYTIPSLGLLSKPIDRQPANKQALFQKAEVILPELEKVIEDINLALTDAIGSLSHPLKSYLPKISKCVQLENSLLGPDFQFELPGVPSEENAIPKDSKIREVVYKIHKNEAERLRGLNILSKDGEEELILRVKPVSVRYDMVPGDLMLVNQTPCEIKSKNSSQQSNEIEFELENVLTGIPQNEKFHSKWDQAHELVLTESLVLVKPNNSKKGYYTLMNLKDSKSTRGLVKAIKTDRTLNDKLQKELETILTEDKRALVQVLRIKNEDIIVSCKKLRK